MASEEMVIALAQFWVKEYFSGNKAFFKTMRHVLALQFGGNQIFWVEVRTSVGIT